MWEQIITTLGPMVLEAIGNKFLSEKEKANVDKKIHTAIMKNFGKFSDTSLDCADFDKTIHGYKFLELIRNYFFIINDKL